MPTQPTFPAPKVDRLNPLAGDPNYSAGATPTGNPVHLRGVPQFRPANQGATAEQHIRAATRAKQAGDMEAFQIIMQRAQQANIQADRFDPTEGMGRIQKAGVGLNAGVRSVGRHIANLVPDALGGMTDETLQEREALDAPIRDTGAGFAGAVVGEAGASAVPALGVGAAATRLGATIGPRMAQATASPIGRGAIEGAAQGAVMAGPGNRWEGLKSGAAFGSALPAAMGAGSKMARGATRTPEAQALLDRGVDLTPGQMNPKGVVNQLEENAQSLMGQGPMIKAARENAATDFSKAGAREAAAPGAQIADNADPRVMLDDAYKSFEPLYEQAKGFPIVTQKGSPVIVNTGSNEPLAARVAKLATVKKGTAAARANAKEYAENELSRHFKTSDDLLEARSNIRTKIRDLKGSTNSVDKDTAEILSDIEQSFTDALNSQLPADALKALKTADASYGKFKVFEDAMYRAKDQPGGFTPSQLSQAARDSVPSNGAYARGAGGTPREMARQGKEVFDTRSPATGARLLGLPGVPFLRDIVAFPSTLMAGTKTGRRLAPGATAAQKKVAAMVDGATGRLTESQRKSLAAAMQRAATTNMLQQSRESE
jgi:hypothetical protein